MGRKTVEAAPGFEQGGRGFADPGLAPWLRRPSPAPPPPGPHAPPRAPARPGPDPAGYTAAHSGADRITSSGGAPGGAPIAHLAAPGHRNSSDRAADRAGRRGAVARGGRPAQRQVAVGRV